MPLCPFTTAMRTGPFFGRIQTCRYCWRRACSTAPWMSRLGLLALKAPHPTMPRPQSGLFSKDDRTICVRIPPQQSRSRRARSAIWRHLLGSVLDWFCRIGGFSRISQRAEKTACSAFSLLLPSAELIPKWQGRAAFWERPERVVCLLFSRESSDLGHSRFKMMCRLKRKEAGPWHGFVARFLSIDPGPKWSLAVHSVDIEALLLALRSMTDAALRHNRTRVQLIVFENKHLDDP